MKEALFYISFTFGISYLLILWFETDFYAEYAQLLGIHKFSKSLAKFLKSGSRANYRECLLKDYGSFFTKLITCPICLNTWLNIIAGLIIFLIKWQVISTLCFISISTYCSLVLYNIYAKLANH